MLTEVNVTGIIIQMVTVYLHCTKYIVMKLLCIVMTGTTPIQCKLQIDEEVKTRGKHGFLGLLTSTVS